MEKRQWRGENHICNPNLVISLNYFKSLFKYKSSLILLVLNSIPNLYIHVILKCTTDVQKVDVSNKATKFYLQRLYQIL